MAKTILGSKFIDQVCKALGIDPANVTQITITATPKDLVRVQVDRLGTAELLNLEAFQPKDSATDG